MPELNWEEVEMYERKGKSDPLRVIDETLKKFDPDGRKTEEAMTSYRRSKE